MPGAASDPDAVGAIITLAGDVSGAAVQISGGSNLDYFDLINPAGINAPTTVTGNGGNDRFFVRAAPAPLTLVGGDGANRYYLSSDAARSLFVTNGVYDDLGDGQSFPFSRLTGGTLEKFTAPVTIVTGNGGNGGSRDAIYLSAAGSATALTNGLVTAGQVTGLGNSAPIAFTTTPQGGVSLLLKLTAGDDRLNVTGVGATTQVFVYGGDGNDTLDVGTAGQPLSAISGIVAFFGEGGSGDTLNVYGVAAPPAPGATNPNQLTAIAVTGLGSGTNSLIATHNDLFGAGYTIGNLDAISSSLEAGQLTASNIQTLADALSQPERPIDSYVALNLSAVTRDALFDFQPGAEVAYRVNTTGSSPVPDLTSDRAYFVSSVDSGTVNLVESLSDQSHPVAVSRSLIGDGAGQVTLAHLDSANRVVVNVSPTALFSGNQTITDNKIVFASDHHLGTGEPVVYHVTGGNAPIGGLTDGHVYYVIKVDNTTIQLSSSPNSLTPIPLTSPSAGATDTLVSQGTALFNANSGVNSNQITFAGKHGFSTGQAVVYHAANVNGTGNVVNVGGLTDGQVYYVIRIDDTTIRLASSLPDAQNGVFLNTLSPIAAATTKLDSLSTARSFAQSSVAGGTIVFSSNPGLVERQAVVYSQGTGSAPLGLANGQVYYVKLVSGNDKAIQLAAIPGGAAIPLATPGAGATGVDMLTPAATFDPSSLHVHDDQITFPAAHNLLDGQRVIYRAGDGNSPIVGLTNGQPYYVVSVDATTIELAKTPGGAPIHLDTESTAAMVPVVTTPTSQLVAQDLNTLISGPQLYDAQRFAGVTLRPETMQLLSQFPQGNSVLNRLLLEDAYPQGLPRIADLAPELPAAIYYAQRFVSRTGAETISSTVENVNIHLGGDANSLQIDSTFAGSTTVDGGTDTTITLGSSLSGLHPATPRRVAFLNGSISLTANTVVFDDSGDDQRTTGTLDGNQVTGLGIPGTVTLLGTPSTTIELGANDDTFYIPATAAGQSFQIETGGGYDKVYVGTHAGAESTGSLAGLQGSLLIDGGSVLQGVNTLYVNDQAETTPQNYIVTNDYDWTKATNNSSTIDTTTITRDGLPIVRYQHEETVVLSAGQGGNTIDIQQTHREQSTDGSTSSTFTANAGAGDDSITLGAPAGNGQYSMDGFQQDVVAPTFTGTNQSRRGIPVLINAQGGDDSVSIRDTADINRARLGITQTQFRDLFPVDPDAFVDSADMFTAAFGESALSRPFTTVALAVDEQRPINVSVRESAIQATRLPGQNLHLTVSLGSVPNQSASFTPSTSSVENNQIVFAANHNLTADEAVVYHKGTGNADYGLEDGQIYYVLLVAGNPNALQLSLTPGGAAVSLSTPANAVSIDRLAPAGNVVQLTSAPLESDVVVNSGDGNDTFNVENGVSTPYGHTLALNGGGGDDSTFVDFNGVSVIDRGALGQTVTSVSYSRDDADPGIPGHDPLTPGTYSVETRFSGSQWQFRLIDAAGHAVPVADLNDATGTGLVANWQNIGEVPVVEEPTGKQALVSRFDSHRGIVLEFGSQYRASGASIADAMRLELAADSSGVVNGVSLAKHGVLGQTVAGVTFSSADVDPAHLLTRGTYYVETQWSGTAWQFRVLSGDSNLPVAVANLSGSGFTSDWQNIEGVSSQPDGTRLYYSGTGLVIDFGPEYQTGSSETETATQILLGVPNQQLALTFDGGTQTADGIGDRLQIAGDGHAAGAIYQPSSTVPGAGTVTVLGNTLAFSGVEPLVVHGLPDFKMLAADQAAVLTIDSAQLANVTREQVQLHTLTVDGQVTWTQKKQFTFDNPALDPRNVGRAIAVSDDGLTMVVGARATSGGATAGALTDGLVLVYHWNGTAWVEQARLEPSDLRLGANFGVDFGASVAIDGNRLVVGAPGDAPASAVSRPFDPSSVDVPNQRIVLSVAPQLADGQAVSYHLGTGNSSIGLIDGQTYYVKLVPGNSTAIQLALTPTPRTTLSPPRTSEPSMCLSAAAPARSGSNGRNWWRMI